MAQNPGGSNVIPQGAVAVGLRLTQGPMLGAHQPMNAPSAPVGQNGTALPQRGGGQQISPSPTPAGAQPIALAGQSIPRSPQAAAAPPVPQQPAFQPPPQHQLGGPAMNGTETHVISVKALGRDGREYVAEFDAVFPVGSQILGVTERPG